MYETTQFQSNTTKKTKITCSYFAQKKIQAKPTNKHNRNTITTQMF